MIQGYAGQILHVNLTTGEIKKTPLDRDLVENFIGGWGINFKYAMDLIKPGIDPLSPENVILLGVGPFVGSSLPGSSKIAATSKFALPAAPDGKSYITSAMSGSRRFASLLKKAGFDHVIITGKAKRPVYLKIFEDEIEICNAAHLWGKKDIYATTDIFTEKYGKCGVIAIGKAGENLCRFSMAITDKKSTLGRSGLGAVLGSKNLKAIITAGNKEIQVADKTKIEQIREDIRRKFKSQKALIGDLNDTMWKTLVMENMNPGVWSKNDWDALYGPRKWTGIRKSIACNSCWIACGSSFKSGRNGFLETESQTGPALWVSVIGQKLELKDHLHALKLLEKMNKAGICAVTSSSMIDWITRRYREGVISDVHTGGMVLRRDINSYMALLDKMINREDFGDRLAEGWFEASNWVGKDARMDYVEGSGIAKGTDCIYPARAATLDPMRFAMGITSPRGGHSCIAASAAALPFTPLEDLKTNAKEMGVPAEAIDRIFIPVAYYGDFNVGRLTPHLEDFNSLTNCLGICELWHAMRLVDASTLSQIFQAITGIEMNVERMKRVGERVYNLYKLINAREGFNRSEDKFPQAWLTPISTPDGIHRLTDYYKKHVITEADIRMLLDDYYDERGWDKSTGIPAPEKLNQLGLAFDLPR
jgi:aldehyde:ferredoxin oxidoreductase